MASVTIIIIVNKMKLWTNQDAVLHILAHWDFHCEEVLPWALSCPQPSGFRFGIYNTSEWLDGAQGATSSHQTGQTRMRLQGLLEGKTWDFGLRDSITNFHPQPAGCNMLAESEAAWRVVKSTQPNWFQSQQSLVVWPSASYLTLLCLRFLICLWG